MMVKTTLIMSHQPTLRRGAGPRSAVRRAGNRRGEKGARAPGRRGGVREEVHSCTCAVLQFAPAPPKKGVLKPRLSSDPSTHAPLRAHLCRRRARMGGGQSLFSNKRVYVRTSACASLPRAGVMTPAHWSHHPSPEEERTNSTIRT